MKEQHMPKTRTETVYPDYSEYLSQSELWPQLDADDVRDDMLVTEMARPHALNAYHKMLTWAASTDDVMIDVESAKRSALAEALLHQAVGNQVVFRADLPALPMHMMPRAEQLVLISEEWLFDALAAYDEEVALVGPVHPLARLRLVMAHLGRNTL
jgi:hypothetical protein